MTWQPITSPNDVDTLIERSHQRPVLIFKHSTTCPISSIARTRLEQDWDFKEEELEPYFLDLLRHRPTSKYIADSLAVHHESPQVLLVRDGICHYDSSHLDISVKELHECYEPS